jgi:hypothetical protein
MFVERVYNVLLLPKLQVAETNLSLPEAQAWVRQYNAVIEEPKRAAVIAEASAPQIAAAQSLDAA